jgi:hypothetical protein
MNTPCIDKPLLAQVPKTTGSLSDKCGRSVPVVFSLSQWRLSIGDSPANRTADGQLEFLNLADAFDLRDIDQGLTLKGGGIQAKVSMLSLHAFSVSDGCVQNFHPA